MPEIVNIEETPGTDNQSKKKLSINGAVALLVSFTATFMAICNIKDGNIVQAMQQAQARTIDAWSYFQAKSTKEVIAAGTLDLLKQQDSVARSAIIGEYKEKIGKYEKEKGDIQKEAEGNQKTYDDLNIFDDQFDLTEAFLSISLSLLGITALTQKRWLLYFASVINVIGFVLGLVSFLKIDLHFKFISGILG
jgi:Domain of unknown function (DUF4337)